MLNLFSDFNIWLKTNLFQDIYFDNGWYLKMVDICKEVLKIIKYGKVKYV